MKRSLSFFKIGFITVLKFSTDNTPSHWWHGGESRDSEGGWFHYFPPPLPLLGASQNANCPWLINFKNQSPIYSKSGESVDSTFGVKGNDQILVYILFWCLWIYKYFFCSFKTEILNQLDFCTEVVSRKHLAKMHAHRVFVFKLYVLILLFASWREEHIVFH